MTNQDDSFFQEVQEGLQRDRAVSLIRKYGPWLAGAFVVLLLGVVGAEWWNDTQAKAAMHESVTFSEAQQQARSQDVDQAITRLDAMTKSGPQVYRVLAMMERAGALQQKGDLQGALAGFDAAAAAASDPTLRDSARLRAAYIVADTQDFQAVQTRLRPLTEGTSQISYLAKELLGVEAWEAGQNDLARQTLEPLSLALEAPESVRQRAQLILNVIGPAPAAAATTPANAARPREGEKK